MVGSKFRETLVDARMTNDMLSRAVIGRLAVVVSSLILGASLTKRVRCGERAHDLDPVEHAVVAGRIREAQMKARFLDRSPRETFHLIDGFATGFSRASASLGFISTALADGRADRSRGQRRGLSESK